MDNNQKLALLTGTKMMLAGAMGFYIYLKMAWPYGVWILVTIAAVTRPGMTHTLSKILMRIIGTIIGCGFAYLVLLFSQNNNIVLLILFFLLMMLSSFVTLQRTIFHYAGVVIGLTLTIALSLSLILGTPEKTIVDRMIDVLIGISCVAIVNALIGAVFPSREKAFQDLKKQFLLAFHHLFQWQKNKNLIMPALAIGIAASLTYFPWFYWRYTGGYWATVSCIFIMKDGLAHTPRKSLFRLYSHVIAALVGAVSALFISNPIFYSIPLLISFFCFGYLMVSHKSAVFCGNTMGIALVIMLLADPASDSTLEVIGIRFLTVIGGIIVGMLVTYLMQMLQRSHVTQ